MRRLISNGASRALDAIKNGNDYATLQTARATVDANSPSTARWGTWRSGWATMDAAGQPCQRGSEHLDHARELALDAIFGQAVRIAHGDGRSWRNPCRPGPDQRDLHVEPANDVLDAVEQAGKAVADE